MISPHAWKHVSELIPRHCANTYWTLIVWNWVNSFTNRPGWTTTVKWKLKLLSIGLGWYLALRWTDQWRPFADTASFVTKASWRRGWRHSRKTIRNLSLGRESSAAHGEETKMAKISIELTLDHQPAPGECRHKYKLKPHVLTDNINLCFQVSSSRNWPWILIGQASNVDFTAFANGINLDREQAPIITTVAVAVQC